MTLQQIAAANNSTSHSSNARHAGRRRGDSPRRQDHSHHSGRGDDNRLAIRQSDVLQISDGNGSLAVLRSKSQLKVRQSDDGSLSFKFKSQLKFDYEFQSDDGTTIKLSAKIKTRISYKENGEESIAFKSRVKFQLSATLENVQSGVEPALASDHVSDEQGAGISSALEGFSELVDRVSNDFLGEAIAGDELLVSIVNAFNELSGSVQSNLPEDVEPEIDPTELPAIEAAADESDAAIPVVETDATTGPVNLEVSAEAVPDEVAVIPKDQPDGEAGVAGASVEAAGEETLPTGDVPAETVTPEAVTPEATQSFSSRSVLVDLRIKFVQSITQLTSVLDSPADDAGSSAIATNTLLSSKLDLRLSAYSQTQAFSETLLGSTVDASA